MDRERIEAYQKYKKRRTKTWLIMMVAFILVLCGVAGTTLAWLKAETTPVVNTFSPSNIEVQLKETTGTEYKMVPGCVVDKDPKAWVTAESEDCYLFIKVEKSENFDAYIDYQIDTQWNVLQNHSEIYYICIDSADAKGTDTTGSSKYNILGEGNKEYDGVTYQWADNQVLVKPTVTKQMMDALGADKPTLDFTAYAVQLYKDNINRFTPEEAWKMVQP